MALVVASVVVGGDGDLMDTLGSSLSTQRLCKNVARGFGLVLHNREGLHYKIWKRRICKMAWVNLSPRLEQDYTA